MELKIDFHYRIGYKPFRAQNTRYRYGQSSVTVSIKEVSANEAPLVARIGQTVDRGTFSSDAYRFSYKPDKSLREIRVIDGKHYVELAEVVNFDKMVSGKGIDKTLFGRKNPRLSDDMVAKTTFTTPHQIERSELNPVRELDYDAEVKNAEGLRKVAEDIVVVDGVVFEYTPQPVLYIDQKVYKQCVVSARPIPASFDDDPNNYFLFKRGSFYSSTSTESLLDAGGLIGALGVKSAPTIEVIDQNAFCYDGASFDTFRIANECLHNMAHNAEKLPSKFLSHFYELRDAMSEADGRITPDVITCLDKISSEGFDFVADSALYMVETLSDLNVKNRLREQKTWVSKGIENIRNTADLAALRWALRPKNRHWLPDIGATELKGDFGRVHEFLSEGSAGDFVYGLGGSIAELRSELQNEKRIIGLNTQTAQGVLSVDSNGEISLLAGKLDQQDLAHVKRYLEVSQVKGMDTNQDDELSFDIEELAL